MASRTRGSQEIVSGFRILAYYSCFFVAFKEGTNAQAQFADLLPLVVRDAASLTHDPSCNERGKQKRDAGGRPRIDLRIKSRYAAPDFHGHGHDSGLSRSPRRDRDADIQYVRGYSVCT